MKKFVIALLFIFGEKHFDCVVKKKLDANTYETECGIVFKSKIKHNINDTLRNFKSPKHQ